MTPENPDLVLARVIEELTEAIRITVDYVGTDVLPPIEGWSWFDALMKYSPDKADDFITEYEYRVGPRHSHEP